MRVTLVVAIAVVAGCKILTGGISSDEAAAIAIRESSLMQARVTAVRQEVEPQMPIDNAVTGSDPNGRVWVVALDGVTDVCPPIPGGACKRVQATSIVYLEFATGAFLQSSTTAR